MIVIAKGGPAWRSFPDRGCATLMLCMSMGSIQMFQRTVSLRRSERGATAIEYAIIAGLIGLGLVGSLVTTRGSLSAVFGTAASRMGSTSSDAATAPVSPRASYWQSKTLVSAVKETSTSTVYTYSDGAVARFVTGAGGLGDTQIQTRDPVAKMANRFALDASGAPTYYQSTRYSDSSLQTAVNARYSPVFSVNSFSGNPPTPTSVSNNSFDSQGVVTRTDGLTPTAADIADAQRNYDDLVYFRSLPPV